MVKGLERYEAINSGEKLAKFQITKSIDAREGKEAIEAVEEGNADEALKIHSKLKSEFTKLLDEEPKKVEAADYSFLSLKRDILRLMLKKCVFCERRCEVNRYVKRGFCRCGVRSYYSSEFLHTGEEPELVPSHTIFFNRCTFACVFCQNYDIVYDDDFPVDAKEIAAVIDVRYRQGSRNVNFVGGNPDQHAHTIMEILLHVRSNIPVVWNSNMYHSTELAEIIEDVVDVWLGDFKYGRDECAMRYSKAPRYWEVVTRNFARAKENGELLIRHLVLPNHIECCTENVVRWVAENLGRDVRFNLMFQYYPTFRAWDYEEIARRLNASEMRRALEIASRWLDNLV